MASDPPRSVWQHTTRTDSPQHSFGVQFWELYYCSCQQFSGGTQCPPEPSNIGTQRFAVAAARASDRQSQHKSQLIVLNDMHTSANGGVVQVLNNDGSGEFKMTQEVQDSVLDAVTSFGSQQALRCLALAYKTSSGGTNKV